MPQFRVFLACITPRDPPIIYITYIMTTAIEFENISKQYRLGLVSTGTLAYRHDRAVTTDAKGVKSTTSTVF